MMIDEARQVACETVPKHMSCSRPRGAAFMSKQNPSFFLAFDWTATWMFQAKNLLSASCSAARAVPWLLALDIGGCQCKFESLLFGWKLRESYVKASRIHTSGRYLAVIRGALRQWHHSPCWIEPHVGAVMWDGVRNLTSACTTRVRKTEVRTTPVRSQQCECQQCEGVNSANETRVRMPTVRMPAVRCDIGAKKVRQQCECQQCESHFFLFYWLKNSTTEFFVFQKKKVLLL